MPAPHRDFVCDAVPDFLLLFDYIHADILAEYLGYYYRAVSKLILLNECGENAAGCKSRAVESVYELGLAVLASYLHHTASCLIITRVGNGGNLFVSIH